MPCLTPTALTVQDGFQAQQATYRGALDAAKNMYQREGWRAFYNGLTPAWLGSGARVQEWCCLSTFAAH